jgi:hypothetical protein
MNSSEIKKGNKFAYLFPFLFLIPFIAAAI